MKKETYMKILSVILLNLTSFFVPVQGILLTLIAFIFADTFIGLAKSIKLKQKISSRSLSRIVKKTMIYVGTTMIVYMADVFILGGIFSAIFSISYMLTKLFAITLCSIEFLSIAESFKMIYGKSLFDVFCIMIKNSKEIKEKINELK